MILGYLSDIGSWGWFLFGCFLLILEIFMPGAFMIWFGLAALAVGTLSLTLFFEAAWWSWQAQLILFACLSFVFVILGVKFFPNGQDNDQAANMHDPLSRFIGQEGVLTQPIENGVGRIKLGDTQWRIRGDDLPKGTKVRICDHDGSALIVEEKP